jgi:ATP-dependent Clp protease protease subunit
MLDTDVNEHSSSLITSQLLFLESQDPDKDILFYINSPGGSVTAGMAIYDTMNFISCEVSTIVMGQACSMGSLLSTAGIKGKRYILPNARHMIHQPLGGSSGQATEVEIQYKELQRWKEVLTNIYVRHTDKDYATLEADMDRDNFMTAQEAVDYGLVDEILENRKKSGR